MNLIKLIKGLSGDHEALDAWLSESKKKKFVKRLKNISKRRIDKVGDLLFESEEVLKEMYGRFETFYHLLDLEPLGYNKDLINKSKELSKVKMASEINYLIAFIDNISKANKKEFAKIIVDIKTATPDNIKKKFKEEEAEEVYVIHGLIENMKRVLKTVENFNDKLNDFLEIGIKSFNRENIEALKKRTNKDCKVIKDKLKDAIEILKKESKEIELTFESVV